VHRSQTCSESVSLEEVTLSEAQARSRVVGFAEGSSKAETFQTLTKYSKSGEGES
jgi:hypothetical protein